MQDQLQEAVRLTKERIFHFETELKREREFLTRLVPVSAKGVLYKQKNTDHWLSVFQAIAKKPMRHEHVIDFTEANALPLSRGAVRVGLNYKVKRGLMKRDKDGFYSMTTEGQDYIEKASS
jgi:hypothetical protein